MLERHTLETQSTETRGWRRGRTSVSASSSFGRQSQFRGHDGQCDRFFCTNGISHPKSCTSDNNQVSGPNDRAQVRARFADRLPESPAHEHRRHSIAPRVCGRCGRFAPAVTCQVDVPAVVSDHTGLCSSAR